MSSYNLSAASDVIVLESGTKNISVLGGKKYIDDVYGKTDKTIPLTGQVNIANLMGDTIVYLSGESFTSSLSGSSYISYLSGALNKTSSLIGSDVSDGWWYITVDTTVYTVDNNIITVDRVPV